MPSKAEVEQRVSSRVPIRVLVEYERIDDFLADYSSNLSLGGMFIRTTQPLDMGTRFRIRFRLPHRPRPVETFGVVRWVVPDDGGPETVPGMGIQFDDLSSADKRAVEKLLTEWD
ncbi:MAG: TIGR02266 family protein [Deltaproteobacteria bacterium]|nr:TIGR02266 family protein [Deltaproteobacteria bacterium]